MDQSTLVTSGHALLKAMDEAGGARKPPLPSTQRPRPADAPRRAPTVSPAG